MKRRATRSNIIPTLKYLWLTCKHKVFVFQAGLKTGAPIWRLIIHDWSKFTPAEAPHYGRQFFGSQSDPEGFERAWLHHQNHNPHHWEYWIPRSGHNRGDFQGDRDDLPIRMPDWAIREMVADWMGASRAYEGRIPTSLDDWKWMQDNLEKVTDRMHPVSVNRLRSILVLVFQETE